MCKRCENNYDYIVEFLDTLYCDDSLSDDEVADKRDGYVREHQLFSINLESYLLCFDGSIIIYDWDEYDFSEPHKANFDCCPICGRKLG